MSNYPTENSLVINTTSQMLTDVDGPNRRAAATSPTRANEKGLGYDVQLSDATRLQFQYKRPVNLHGRFGMTFKVNGQQVSMLSLRDDTGVSYLACPIVENEGQLSKSLKNCYFIDAQAVRSDSSRLYIPDSFPTDPVMTKIKGEDTYPKVPRIAVKDWKDIKRNLDLLNIGQQVRRNGETTAEYQNFVTRLELMSKLSRAWYGVRGRADGGDEWNHDEEKDEQPVPWREEPISTEVAYEIGSELVNHAQSQLELVYSDSNYRPNYEAEEDALWNTIENIAGRKHPEVHHIRRSRELIFETGSQSPPLNLGDMN